MEELVSIIMPSYETARYLEEAVLLIPICFVLYLWTTGAAITPMKWWAV